MTKNPQDDWTEYDYIVELGAFQALRRAVPARTDPADEYQAKCAAALAKLVKLCLRRLGCANAEVTGEALSEGNASSADYAVRLPGLRNVKIQVKWTLAQGNWVFRTTDGKSETVLQNVGSLTEITSQLLTLVRGELSEP